MTLQVVLLGSDGIVDASDRCVESYRPDRNPIYRFTDSVSKIVVNTKLVYSFAGDNCGKEIGATVAKEAADTQKPLSSDFIDEASNRALKEYRETAREWFSKHSQESHLGSNGMVLEFSIWSARYEGGIFSNT